jgi:hypothetical protein
MAWTDIEWACGHTGAIQLYGKNSQRDAKVASEAGRKCLACWLVEQWEREKDPRAQREDRYVLAGDIAKGKGKRIENLPTVAPVNGDNPLAEFSNDQILAEAKRRNLI